jgi:hypothetical protein
VIIDKLLCDQTQTVSTFTFEYEGAYITLLFSYGQCYAVSTFKIECTDSGSGQIEESAELHLPLDLKMLTAKYQRNRLLCCCIYP